MEFRLPAQSLRDLAQAPVVGVVLLDRCYEPKELAVLVVFEKLYNNLMKLCARGGM